MFLVTVNDDDKLLLLHILEAVCLLCNFMTEIVAFTFSILNTVLSLIQDCPLLFLYIV